MFFVLFVFASVAVPSFMHRRAGGQRRRGADIYHIVPHVSGKGCIFHIVAKELCMLRRKGRHSTNLLFDCCSKGTRSHVRTVVVSSTTVVVVA